MLQKILKIWLPYPICSDFYAHSEPTRQELMLRLSICVSSWYTPWALHQFLMRMLSMYISFPIFQMFILYMYTLSKEVRNWCICFDFYAHYEHTRQELMLTLSICASSWYTPWALHQFLMPMISMYISFPIFQMFILYMYSLSKEVRTWCKRWAYASRNDACTDHKCQELVRDWIPIRNWCIPWVCISGIMHSLSICVRNWCVPWA